MRSLVILGSTGSGTQALDVVRHNPDRFKVVGLSAGTNQELLVGQIREFLPPHVAIANDEAAVDLEEKLSGIKGVEVHVGPEAAESGARFRGRHGPERAGRVRRPGAHARHPAGGQAAAALANKESLVIGGDLVVDLIKGEPERLIPVDSEHAALAQCLRGERREDLKRVILTGSAVRSGAGPTRSSPRLP